MTRLDLRGVPCPLNFVRTKLQVEQLAPGDCLEVWLDAGEPIQQVPPSLAMAGHHVRQMTEQPEGHFALVVERGQPQAESAS
ncbi:MAG: sulfurtransferase TusA family protein [Cyanobacteria bacterium J06648_11]